MAEVDNTGSAHISLAIHSNSKNISVASIKLPPTQYKQVKYPKARINLASLYANGNYTASPLPFLS